MKQSFLLNLYLFIVVFSFLGYAANVSNPHIASKFQEDDSKEYEIIVSIDEMWDGFSIPIPLKIIVRNNSSEVIYLNRNACGGGNILELKDAKGIAVPQIDEKLDEKQPVSGEVDTTIKVREGGCAGRITIEPGKEFSYSGNIGKSYNLLPLQEYDLTIKRVIHYSSVDLQAKVEVTSSPLKLIVRPLEQQW